MLDVAGHRCVIVGGGDVAARKATTLADHGADVFLVAPAFCDAIEGLASRHRIAVAKEPFSPHHLDGASLAFAATNDKDVNRKVYQEAQVRRIPVNVADAPQLCTFTVPSQVKRGDLTIAISTGGASPAVARRLRERLETEFGDEWGAYLALMASLRNRAMQEVHDPGKRRDLFAALAESDLFEKVAAGDDAGIKRLVEEAFGS